LIQYSHDISEYDTFNHIIYNLKPKIYEITLAMIKREMNDPSYIPNLHNLKRDIRQIYTNSKSTTATTNKSGEMILAAIQPKSKSKFKKQFKGECRLRGTKGHKAADCWDDDKNKSKRPNNQILLLLKILKRKSLNVTIVIEKVTPYNVVTKTRKKIGKKVKIIIWFVLPLMVMMTLFCVKR
jgi:type I site-specific restriction-modification system R (restriction) subunit